MVVVDTSVWVAALRNARSAEAKGLQQLLDEDRVALAAPVRVEILVGASPRDRARLRRLLSAVPIYYPTAGTWQRIDAWIERAGAVGERFGFADLLIGTLAAEHGSAVWSLDADFTRMARAGLLALHNHDA